jgi:ABC-type nitrate/sulfonate/bicarbonate transport system substrate-binding protein
MKPRTIRSVLTARPRRSRVLLAALGSLVLASTAAACGSSGGQQATGSSSGPTTVRVIYDWPGIDFEAVPIVVGQKEGFYKKAGLDVQLILPPDNATTVKMLAVGKGDIGFDTTSDVAFARAAGIPVKSIANYSQTNNWGLVTKPGKPVDLSNLNGKSIGIFTDSWTKAMMPYVLKAGHVSASQVKQVIFQNTDLTAMMAGKIDIATNTMNYAVAQIQSATGKKPSTMLASKFGAPDVPIWVYTAMDSWLSSHGKDAKAFLAATKQATAWAIAHPTKAVDDFIAAYPKNGSSKKYNQLGWENTIACMKGPDGLFTQRASQWTQLVGALKAVNLLKQSFPASAYYTNKYLP